MESILGPKMNDFPRSVAIVTSTDARIYRFCMPVVRKLLERGVTVYAIAPPGKFVTDIERSGVIFVPWEMDRFSLNPLSGIRHVIALASIYRFLKPDMVHHFTAKPNVYGAVAARLARVPVVLSGVTGLGYAFAPAGLWRRILRSWVLLLYRVAANLSDRLTFQTQHDIDTLLGARGSLRSKAVMIKGGSGVDLSTFNPDSVSSHDRERARVELGIEPGALVVTMAARMLYEKGVSEYAEAARLVRSRQPDICFVLAGEVDSENPGSVTREDIKAWLNESSFKYIGHRGDIQVILAMSDVVVHPTYYPEGIPRILIEAAAMGKPIISTPIPGIREIVEDGVNGVIVPPRDAGELAAAIGRLAADADARGRYGAAGQRKVKLEYDDSVVADRYVAEYRRVWMHTGARRRQRNVKERTFTLSLTDPRTNEFDDYAAYLPAVSVIIPARNSKDILPRTLDSILAQDYSGPIEVIVADGSDTAAISEMLRRRYPAVRIVLNPEHTTSVGLNRALRAATGEVIVRCDTHAMLSPNYVRRAIATLARTGAAHVGGRQYAVGDTVFEWAVAMAFSTFLGVGDARHRLGGAEGPTDTVYLGAWPRKTLEALGGFDPTLLRNQDYEINWRLRQQGEMVWFDPELVAKYRPRGTLWALARQYFNYGRWKRVVLSRHPSSLRIRHLAAPLLVLGLAASGFLALGGAPWAVAAALPLTYLFTLGVGICRRAPAALLLPLVLATMHLSWGIGFFLPPRVQRGRASDRKHGPCTDTKPDSSDNVEPSQRS